MKKSPTMQLREKLNLPRAAFARLLKVSENTVFRWDIGKVRPDPLSKQKLEHLATFCERLQTTAPTLDIPTWLEQPHNELENFRPIDLIDSEFGRRRLHQVVERLGKIQNMPLPARRAIAEFQEKDFPQALQDIETAAGFAVPVEVHWEHLAHQYRPPEAFAESFQKGLFIPLIEALKTIASDAIGKDALRQGLQKIVIAEKRLRASGNYELQDGILRISKNPSVFYSEVKNHTEELRKVLESNL